MAQKVFNTNATIGGNVTNVAGNYTTYGVEAEHVGQWRI